MKRRAFIGSLIALTTSASIVSEAEAAPIDPTGGDGEYHRLRFMFWIGNEEEHHYVFDCLFDSTEVMTQLFALDGQPPAGIEVPKADMKLAERVVYRILEKRLSQEEPLTQEEMDVIIKSTTDKVIERPAPEILFKWPTG